MVVQLVAAKESFPTRDIRVRLVALVWLHQLCSAVRIFSGGISKSTAALSPVSGRAN